jgi:hypothetical protein
MNIEVLNILVKEFRELHDYWMEQYGKDQSREENYGLALGFRDSADMLDTAIKTLDK